MTQQEGLTDWLASNIIWPRITSDFLNDMFCNRFENFSDCPEPRPSTWELADELLGIAGFRALQLGTWLATPDGEMLTTAVEAVSPPSTAPTSSFWLMH
jgi:hypothetical protein